MKTTKMVVLNWVVEFFLWWWSDVGDCFGRILSYYGYGFTPNIKVKIDILTGIQKITIYIFINSKLTWENLQNIVKYNDQIFIWKKLQ